MTGTAKALDDVVAALTSEPGVCALLLDFDGTLAEITADPTATLLDDGTVDTLHDLSAALGLLAIVSGRPGEFLAERLAMHRPGSRLRAFGRGGLDEVLPGGEIRPDRRFDDLLPLLGDMARRGRDLAPRATIEEKGVVTTFHWRRDPECRDELREFALASAHELGLAWRAGKQSVELYPEHAPTKGSVVATAAAHFATTTFIGDDVGDLDAFDALDAAGGNGFRGCVLGEDVPEELVERADFVLEGPAATRALLAVVASGLSR